MYVIIFLLTLFFPTFSYAYLGPAVGGGIIAATIGLIIAIFAAIFGILWFPIKRFIKKKRNVEKEKKKN